MSKSTIADIVKRYVRIEDRIKSIPQKECLKLLDSRDKRKIIRKVNPRLSATKLTSELYEETSKKVHRALKEDYNNRIARKKPFINEANPKKRLIFVKEFISKEQIWCNIR